MTKRFPDAAADDRNEARPKGAGNADEPLKQSEPDKEVTHMPFEHDIGDSAPKSKTRKSISTRTRFEIFKRDQFTCQYCGAKPPAVILHVDHIIAVANGGANDTGNLTTACQRCNLGKSAVPLSSVPKSLEDAALEADEMRCQVEAYAEMLADAREAEEGQCWNVAEVIQPGASDGWSTDKFKGVKQFIRKIGYPQTLEAAHIAADAKSPGNQRFRYFCGICWNRVRDAES